MANFTRAKPLGWADWPLAGSQITAAEVNQLDTDHIKAPNFEDGSAHTPAANIEITGPNCLKLMGTLNLALASRSITRVHDGLASPFTAADWSADSGAGIIYTTQNLNGSVLYFPVDVPHGSVITACSLAYDGMDGGRPGLPTMPVIHMCQVSAAGALTAWGPGTDTSATVVAFEAWHVITLSALAITVDRTQYRYMIRLTPETGGGPNQVAGARAAHPTTTCTITAYTEY